MKRIPLYYRLFAILVILLAGCEKSWDDHYKVQDKALDIDLVQATRDAGDLNLFNQYLVKTGFDKQLASSKSFIIWAPTDNAMNTFGTAALNDTARLRKIIGSSICYNTVISDDSVTRLQMFSGKYANYDPFTAKLENIAVIRGKDIVCRNGVIHRMESVFEPKKNIWDYFLNISPDSKQKTCINNMFVDYFDDSLSTRIAVDEKTGQTIYDSVKVKRNSYLVKVADLSVEKDQYTWFILSDDAYDVAYLMYRSYYVLGDSVNADGLSSFSMLADLVVSGKHTSFDNPMSTITGETLLVDQSMITATVEASNGIIYFLNTYPIAENVKFKPFIIEAESFDNANYTSWIVRSVGEASGGYDFFYNNPSTVLDAWVQYNITVDYPIKCSFSWVSYAPDTTEQVLSIYNVDPIKTDTALYSFNYVMSSAVYSDEKTLGKYTFREAKDYTLRVTNRPSAKKRKITLDYIKLTPVKL